MATYFVDKSFLQTGDIFTAKDRLGRSYRYRFIGLDPQNLTSGTGCAYLVLMNLDSNTETCVEAEWFRQRTIKKINIK